MGISPWQLLIILAIVLLLFGTKRLRSMGGDLGEAIKSFKKSVSDEDKKDEDEDPKSVESQKRESAESTEQREDEKNRS